MAPFYGWGSIALRLEPFRGGSLLFTTKYHYFYQVFPICLQNPFIMAISKKYHAEWETNFICKWKKKL